MSNKDPYLDSLFNNVMEGIVITDKEGIVLRVNPQFSKIFGYKQSEILGKSIDELIAPIENRYQALSVTKRVAEGENLSFDAVRYSKDLQPIDVSVMASPIIIDGKLEAIYGIYRDITHRKQKQKNTQQESAKLSAVIAGMEEGIVLVDNNNQIVEANDYFCRLYQLEKSDVTKKGVFEFYFGFSLEKLKENIAHFKETPNSLPVASQATIQKIEAMVRLQPIYVNDQFEGLIINIIDATELIAAKKEAQEADRIKTELLANISHEIRTPMNGILGMVDLALETDLSPDQKEYLNGIKSSAQSLLFLLNDFLDLSKIEAKKVELESATFNITEFVNDIVKSFSVQASKKKLELLCDIPFHINYNVIGDPGRLSQVLKNLIDNGVKYTDEGEVVVAIQEESKSENGVTLEFSVIDTGIGIPLEKRKVIFNAFSQADGSMTRKYGGTGLGLSISAELVQLMGGEIKVESNVSRGSTFFFTMPFTLPPDSKEQSEPQSVADYKGLPALVVDDNDTSRRILVDMLKGFNLNPSESKSGDDAISKMDQAAKEDLLYSIIFIDAYLEDNDSFMLLDYFRQYSEQAKSVVLLLNSSLKKEIPVIWKRLDISSSLLKPIKIDDLLDTINSTLGLFPQSQDQTMPDESSKPSEEKSTLNSLQELPSQAEKQTSLDESQTPSEQTDRCYRILLADDNIVNRKVAQFTLQKKGHQVISVQDGQEALSALENHIVDLILMDVQMPKMDGFQATKLIREKEKVSGHHVPIIALTAHAMKGDREKCLEAGMDDYLAKPIKPEALFDTIDRTIKKLRTAV